MLIARKTAVLGTILGVVFLMGTHTGAVNAQTAPYGPYGDPDNPNNKLIIDKLVSRVANADPMTVEYVDNLSQSDTRFKAGETISFKLRVKNETTVTSRNARIEDFVPPYIEPQNGVTGWNPANRSVTINAGEVAPGQTKDFIIPMRVFSADRLPNSAGVLCVSNNAQVGNNDVTDADSAQFCIETPNATPTPTPTTTPGPSATPAPTTTPAPTAPPQVTVVPKTGAAGGILVVAAELFTLGAGIFLKRKVS